MLRITIISFLVSAALTQWTPTLEDLSKLSEFSRTLDNKVKVIRDTPITLHVGSTCIQDADCDDGFSCFNIAAALFDFLNRNSHLNELEFLAKKARITGKECVVESLALFEYFTAEEYSERAMELVARIKQILSDEEGLFQWGNVKELFNIKLPNVTYTQKLLQKSTLTRLREPMTMHTGFGQTGGGGSDTNTLFLLLALRGSRTGTNLDNNLLTLLLLSGQAGGIDKNFLNNPFLLFLLLGNDNSNTNSNNKNLLLYLLLLSPNGGLGGSGEVCSVRSTGLGLSQDTLFSNPLIISSLLSNSRNSSSGINDLVPIILLSGGGLVSDPNNPTGGLLSFFLLKILRNSSILDNNCLGLDKTFLIFLLFPGALGGGGCLESILPFLLLTNSSLLGISGINDNWLISQIYGDLGGSNPNGGLGDGGLGSILPLLLLTSCGSLKSSGSNDDLFLFLLSSGVLSSGMRDIGGIESRIELLLPFILLSNNSGSNDNTLLLILFLTLFNQPAPTPVFPQLPIIPQ